DLLHLHLCDQNARLIAVEHFLHEIVHAGFDVLASASEDGLNFRAANHFAHGTLGHGLHGALGILNVEQKVADALRLDAPENREIDIDDVFVAGQHQAFFRHVAHGGAATDI